MCSGRRSDDEISPGSRAGPADGRTAGQPSAISPSPPLAPIVLSQYVLVRLLHVLGGAILLGGSATLWFAFRVAEGVDAALLWWYEAVFWFVFGAIVFTGTGNLAGFGAPLAGTDRWVALTAKLALVLALAVCSLVRTFGVARLPDSVRTTTNARLRLLYGLTALSFAVVFALAGVLARG